MSTWFAWTLCVAAAALCGDVFRRRWMPGYAPAGPARVAAAWLLGQLLQSVHANHVLTATLPPAASFRAGTGGRRAGAR
ncbi:MAG: hypothetical protein AAFY88_02480, partial [Acidobacteriota bacterium]